MEDDIDLRKYTDVLRRRWILIVSITTIAVFVAGLISFLEPHTFEARSAVLITKARSEITLEPKYKTVMEDDFTSQKKSLIALAKSGLVATQVIEELGVQLDPEEKIAESILDTVQVRNQGDLIEIYVRSTDPQKAAAIANAWSESYESYVNGLYSGMLITPEELESQADVARKEYEEKQMAWEGFISDNRIAELGRQISDKELLCDVKSLREQIEAGSSSPASTAANSLAIIHLQGRAFGSLPFQLHSLDWLSSLETSQDKQLHDIDLLISTLEARSGSTPGQSIVELRQEILQLRGELEKEQARKRGLQNSRDIAWETCKTLGSKAAEVKVSTQMEDAVVRVAKVAIVPERPGGPRRMMNIGIALVLGLVVGVLAAFGAEYFRKRPKEKTKGEGTDI